jgi:hypothetical protein
LDAVGAASHPSSWAQDLDTWKMIPPKRRFGSGCQSDHCRYEAHPDAEIWTFYRVRADGTWETFDEKQHPCGDLGFEEMPDTVVSRKNCPSVERERSKRNE